jgi:GrpB protein
VIDIDLTVPDSRREQSYVPALESCGFQLVIREPWRYEHRCLRHHAPACNLHVFSRDCPEASGT